MQRFNKPQLTGFDVIGDLHGCATPLKALLTQLGYSETEHGWGHPDRISIFVGDYVDRGPEIREVLTILKAMVESGNAVCLMGNHEYNAIGWTLPDGRTPGEFLRPHSVKNTLQHEETLKQLGDDYLAWIAWFKTLPLWLELDIRGQKHHFIHACWSQDDVDFVLKATVNGEPIVTGDASEPRLTEAGFKAALTSETALNTAVEKLLKGVEIDLPPGKEIIDVEGTKRTKLRVQWWKKAQGTYRDIAFAALKERMRMPETEVEPEAFETIDVPCPTFIGHYGLTAESGLFTDGLVTCLDYNVHRGGPLGHLEILCKI